MFDNIGDSIKKYAKILFHICLWCGIIILVIGLFRFLSSIKPYVTFSEALTCTLEDAILYDSLYEDAYYGRMQMKIGFYGVLCAFSMLPVYGIGELVCLCQTIKWDIKELVEKTKEKEGKL